VLPESIWHTRYLQPTAGLKGPRCFLSLDYSRSPFGILDRLGPRRRKLSSNSNKKYLSPTIAIAIYIDEANPMPRNWEKEE